MCTGYSKPTTLRADDDSRDGKTPLSNGLVGSNMSPRVIGTKHAQGRVMIQLMFTLQGILLHNR